ncbi:MAG: hypothetical protein WCF94_03935, partial [bacterium]
MEISAAGIESRSRRSPNSPEFGGEAGSRDFSCDDKKNTRDRFPLATYFINQLPRSKLTGYEEFQCQ